MIYFDKFSKIGGTHSENQDYSIVGNENNPFIMVLDGCSSSKDVSVGARILGHCMIDFMRYYEYDTKAKLAAMKAGMLVKNMGLPTNCLDATLMYAYIEGDLIKICIWGDGCIVIKSKIDGIKIIDIKYTIEMPYYISYQVDKERDNIYKQYAEETKLKKIIERNSEIEMKSDYINPLCHLSIDILKNDIEYILLCTDGIFSFNNDIILRCDLINSPILQFKNLKGEFVQRRLKRMFKENQGLTHYDDLTIAGMSFVDEIK
ncbi:MAG: protein phosphatase 2C domain-containing protein [Candidatus Zixiibacteriota bacterium]|nr:MAG: protein phosphatase 2C domain-containing protein [candidate division Zixibacteria bacterium]